MSILKKYKDKGLELFFDVLSSAIFPEEEVEKERKFILAEIREKQDDPMRICIETCDSLIYEKHPYGMTTLGTEKSIKKIKREDILDFYNKYVSGENLCLSIVGDIEPEEIASHVERLFQRQGNGNTENFPVPQEEMPSVKKKKKIIKKDIKQSSISIGFLGCNITGEEDYFPFVILNSVLNGMGSRLFIELRDIKGLAYVVFCYLTPGIENGSFKTYIATGPELEKEAINAMLYELEKLKTEGVLEEEVEKAKNMIKGRYQMNLQERAFARTVEAQHADFGAVEKGQGNVLDDRLLVVEPGYLQHGIDDLIWFVAHGNTSS